MSEFLAWDPATLAAIAAMAAATYATRLFGYALLRRRRLGARAEAALAAMPGAILTALVAPVALATGPAESGAALITLLAARRLPLVVAVLLGAGTAALLRRLV